jgi:predicted nuclease with TOPRIM domain
MTFTNNKFQSQCMELEKQLFDSNNLIKEKEMRNKLLNITIENLQKELFELKSRYVDLVSSNTESQKEKQMLIDNLESDLNTLKSEKESLLLEIRRVSLERLPEQKEEQGINYEDKFNELKRSNKELLSMYTLVCEKNHTLESEKTEFNKRSIELGVSLQTTRDEVVKYRDENTKLRRDSIIDVVYDSLNEGEKTLQQSTRNVRNVSGMGVSRRR